MEEVFASHEKRNLLGFEVKTDGHGDGSQNRLDDFPSGTPLDRNKKYVIAFNSFDARSGGHHFMKLRAFLDRPEANYVLHPVQTRDALIDYFQRHKIVRRIAAVNPLGVARIISSPCKSDAFCLPIPPCGSNHFASDWFAARYGTCVVTNENRSDRRHRRRALPELRPAVVGAVPIRSSTRSTLPI